MRKDKHKRRAKVWNDLRTAYREQREERFTIPESQRVFEQMERLGSLN